MKEFIETVLKHSQINTDFLENLHDVEVLPPIECGIVFVLATWSGDSIVRFRLLTGILKQVHLGPLKIFVINADRIDPRKFVACGFPLFHGWGETYWIKDSNIAHLLTRYGPEKRSEVISYTEELMMYLQK